MQASGCRPHTAVFSSIIDVLWQTGIAWAQAKARKLFATAVKYVSPLRSTRHYLWSFSRSLVPQIWSELCIHTWSETRRQMVIMLKTNTLASYVWR